MDIIQSSIPELAHYEPTLSNDSKESNIDRAILLTAKIPSIVAAWNRLRNNLQVVQPVDNLSHAAAFFICLAALSLKMRNLKYSICVLYCMQNIVLMRLHLLPREIASTGAHMYASIGGAVGALSGHLHGGANVKVMQMLLDIGDVKNVERWVTDRLGRGGKIMGMGHAVYKTTDPRADILSRLARILTRERETKWFEITEKVEKITKKYMLDNKKQVIYPNVDLYSACLSYTLGYTDRS